MEMSEKGFMHCQLWDSLLNLVRHMCSSKQGKIGMAGSMQGCSGIGKKDPGSIFFLRPFLLD